MNKEKRFVKKIEWVGGRGWLAFGLQMILTAVGAFLADKWGLGFWQIILLVTIFSFSGALAHSWEFPKLKSYWVEQK